MLRRRPALPPGPAKQRGQALLFVTVTALVMLLAMLTMFNMGQLTTEKMKLQNTADAAAYSAAVAQARDYNFSAYLNRGMIANDVAVAQLVGLASWSRNYYDTFHDLIPRLDAQAAGTPGPLYPILWSLPHGIANSASGPLKNAFEGAAKTFVPILLSINETFAGGQKIYHFGTALTVAQTLGVDDKFNDIMQGAFGFDLGKITEFIKFGNTYNVIKLNDPNASLSLLGVAGFAYNTYQWNKFTSDRNPLGPWGTEARDDSYTTHDCRAYWIICWGGYEDNYHHEITYLKHDADATDDGPKKDRMAGVVTRSLDEFTTDRSKMWWAPQLVDPLIVFGPNAYINGWFFKMLFHDGATKLADDRGPSGRAGGPGFRKDDSWNQRWTASDSTTAVGIVTCPVVIFGWTFNIPCRPIFSGSPGTIGDDASGTASAGPNSGDLSKDKTALRIYRDVTDIEQATDKDHQNLRSPPLLVEIERPTNTISTSANVTANSVGGGRLGIGRSAGDVDPAGCGIGNVARNAPQISTAFGRGNLDVGDGAANNCMRAISKAEAYFSRPSNLFPREDKLAEYGSLYSPYWQARLMPNSAAEQSASLILHGLRDFQSFGAGLSGDATELLKLTK